MVHISRNTHSQTWKNAELAHRNMSLIHTVTASPCSASKPFPSVSYSLEPVTFTLSFLSENDISRIKTLGCCCICVSRILATDACSKLVDTSITCAKPKQVCSDRTGVIDVTAVQ